MRARARIGSHPIHPILVTFPIGLFIISLIFDLIGVFGQQPALWMAAWYGIAAGLIGGALAAVAGLIDLFSVVPPDSSARSRGYKHAILNVVVMALFLAVLAYRGNAGTRPNGLALALSIIGVGVLLVSGWLGATLVYRNQIGGTTAMPMRASRSAGRLTAGTSPSVPPTNSMRAKCCWRKSRARASRSAAAPKA